MKLNEATIFAIEHKLIHEATMLEGTAEQANYIAGVCEMAEAVVDVLRGHQNGRGSEV